MRRVRSSLLSVCLVLTFLVTPRGLEPAHATPTKVNCSKGGYVSIENNAVLPVYDASGFARDICSGSLTLPTGVTSIPDFVFDGSGVENVTIPTSVISIGNAAFAGAGYLVGINVAEPNATYTSTSGILFNNDKTTLIAYPSGKRVETYTVPASVQSIRNYAFYNNQFYSIVIPTSVSSIELGAFRTNENLQTITVTEPNESYTSIGGVLFNDTEATLVAYPHSKSAYSYSIPDGVMEIGDFAFYGQRHLSDISIPPTVTSIGDFAFYEAWEVEYVNLDAEGELTSIGDSAFEGAQWLKSMQIPDSVKTIGSRAFVQTDLVSIDIPAGLESIGSDAFEDMGFLERITVNESNSNYESLDGVLFDESISTLIAYPVERGRAYYTIPLGVTSISTTAFSAQPHYWSTKTHLQFLTIASSVTSIENWAFARNDSLEEVIFEPGSQLETIGDEAFSGSSLSSITIPAAVTSIGKYAFYSNENLIRVKFGSGSQLNSIAESAFAYTGITTITIPKNLTSMGKSAFYGNGQLKTIKFETGSQLKSIGDGALAFCQISAITIPASVTSIGKEAFEQMNSSNAFSVYFLGNAPTTTGNLVDYPDGLPAYIKSGSKGFSKIGSAWKGLTVTKTPTAAIVKPSISGVAQVSKTLTVNSGQWIGYTTPKITYQWYSCTTQVKSVTANIPKTCKAISNSTKPTRVVSRTLKGRYLAVLVTGKSTGTTATKWLSKSTAKVK